MIRMRVKFSFLYSKHHYHLWHENINNSWIFIYFLYSVETQTAVLTPKKGSPSARGRQHPCSNGAGDESETSGYVGAQSSGYGRLTRANYHREDLSYLLGRGRFDIKWGLRTGELAWWQGADWADKLRAVRWAQGSATHDCLWEMRWGVVCNRDRVGLYNTAIQ